MKNESLQSMKRIKLDGMAAAYEAVLSLPVNQQPPAHEMIARLIDAEAQHRKHRRTELFLRLSKLRYQAGYISPNHATHIGQRVPLVSEQTVPAISEQRVPLA